MRRWLSKEHLLYEKPFPERNPFIVSQLSRDDNRFYSPAEWIEKGRNRIEYESALSFARDDEPDPAPLHRPRGGDFGGACGRGEGGDGMFKAALIVMIVGAVLTIIGIIIGFASGLLSNVDQLSDLIS